MSIPVLDEWKLAVYRFASAQYFSGDSVQDIQKFIQEFLESHYAIMQFLVLRRWEEVIPQFQDMTMNLILQGIEAANIDLGRFQDSLKSIYQNNAMGAKE